MFLSFTFGLPVVAADVGSFREDVVEDRTGFLFRPRDREDLIRAIEAYFGSELFKNLGERRGDLRRYFREHHSWNAVALMTRQVYAQLARQ
jgi:glycosyltransferase involved in cell wall biosynthesis